MKIVITGPRSVGKTTASRLVAKRLGLPCVSSDELLDQRLSAYGGLIATMKNGPRQPINDEGIALVKETMARSDDFVFDLAGGAIGSPDTRDTVLPCLSDAIVIGLLPSEDDARSIELLMQRERRREHFRGADEEALRAKVEHDYLRLKQPLLGCAQQIITIEDKSAEEIAAEIAVAVASS
jgi:shikimate kinase